MIKVTKKDEKTFTVEVSEGRGTSTHTVTLEDSFFEKLTGEKASAGGAGSSGAETSKTSKEHLIEKSFEFLLERESKESILGRFDLSVISRYFPEYEKEIGRRL